MLPLAVCVYVATPDDVPDPMSCVASPARSLAPLSCVELVRDRLVILESPEADSACVETVYADELTAQHVIAQSPAAMPGSVSYVKDTLVPADASVAIGPDATDHDPVALRNAAVRAHITLTNPLVAATLIVPLSDPVATFPNA